MKHIITSLQAEDDFQSKRRIEDFESITTVAGTVTLTATSATTQVVTGSTGGLIIKLPNATTLSLGIKFYFYNSSTVGIQIQANDGTVLANVSSGIRATFLCTSIASIPGTWAVQNNAAGVDYSYVSNAGPYSNSSSTVFLTTATLTTGYLPPGNYRWDYSMEWTAVNNNRAMESQIDDGGTPIELDSYYSSSMFASAYYVARMFGVLNNISGVHTLNIGFRVLAAGGATTITVVNPRLELYRVK